MDFSRVRRARAWGPCHVTGIVLPETSARDPRARGSRGAGLVLDVGVTAEAKLVPGARTSVRLEGPALVDLAISREVARRLARGLAGRLTVRLAHDLPIGQGFGTSAAGATATALAVSALGGPRRRHAIEVAHLADLFGGGGLGGVAAILGGGLEVRRVAGLPPAGRIVRREHPGTVLLGVAGPPLPSPRLLSDPAVRARLDAAADLFDALDRHPDPGTFWDVAEAFTSRVRLCPIPLARLLRALRRRGARAAQTMFGNAFFARAPRGPRRRELDRWLVARGIATLSTTVADHGARSLAVPRADAGR